jgi:hypothetical protein
MAESPNIPGWGRTGRRLRRETARELAKHLMHQNPRTSGFRWDITLSLLVAVMAIAIVFSPPSTQLGATVWLFVMFALGVYPALHFSGFVVRSPRRKWATYTANVVGVLVFAAAVTLFGIFVWHPHRHVLSPKERLAFQNSLSAERGGDANIEIQIACPTTDERACVYAGQFIDLFGLAGWKIRPDVQRLAFNKASEGITVLRRAGNLDDMQKRWDSGGYVAINEAHLLAVHAAFKTVRIEIDSSADPQLAENEMLIYVGPEKDDESEPTRLTKNIEWVTGKRLGPFPTQ